MDICSDFFPSNLTYLTSRVSKNVSKISTKCFCQDTKVNQFSEILYDFREVFNQILLIPNDLKYTMHNDDSEHVLYVNNCLFCVYFHLSQETAGEPSWTKSPAKLKKNSINTITIIWLTKSIAISVLHIHCHIVPRGWRGWGKKVEISYIKNQHSSVGWG